MGEWLCGDYEMVLLGLWVMMCWMLWVDGGGGGGFDLMIV